MKKFLLAVLMIIPILVIQSCKTKTDKSDKLSGSISIDGSSTVYPITEAVAEEFRQVQPDVKVTVGLSGTGGGFKKFCRGETDINDASRPIKDEEIELANKNNIKYIDLMIAFDGLAVIVHPENNWCSELTVEELKKIWEPEAQNKITRWNQIRPEWPNEEIHLFGPGVESGTYDYFTEAVVGKSHSSRGDFTASEDDNVLVQGVASDKFSLGFFGLAYYEENMDKLKLVGINSGNGAVLPSLETVRNKSYYLARPLFIYINNNAAEKKEVQEFVTFYLDHADALSKEVGYIPLTEDELASQNEKWTNFKKEHQPK
ncbi:MAG TPA: PstS family phosphate ABC transporter substrate-binding protein [Bacteroidia bacterium]|nr:PstS family phosphate ABC transporter substrate-binding protein [Bacteroidia bacterium]HRS57845.1 PstS family phosphate ABC transporter substrate-binding protein [Bacteroidia bacterium]HRU67815.1 PstS family phosphate ABC transporter substrate-binding protein [Bacteroidia bacterium]